ncbi:helix-turn-helix domain-containing protein [Streptomyces sp. NPDC058171]
MHLGHHLTRHRTLSCTAIGLAAHLLSLPDGSPADIRSLAARLPEGRDRIASALRELEKHGYLERVRKNLPNGTWVTLTYVYEDPTAARTAPEPAPEVTAPPAPKPTAPSAPAAPTERPPPPPLPSPTTHAPHLHDQAAELLASLRTADPRLTLAQRDVRRLAPAVATWLERGTHPDAVRTALTTGLPAERLHHPGGFVAYRLAALLPPPLPRHRTGPPAPPPLQNCEGCDRAFRAPHPGRCPHCRSKASPALHPRGAEP